MFEWVWGGEQEDSKKELVQKGKNFSVLFVECLFLCVSRISDSDCVSLCFRHLLSRSLIFCLSFSRNRRSSVSPAGEQVSDEVRVAGSSSHPHAGHDHHEEEERGWRCWRRPRASCVTGSTGQSMTAVCLTSSVSERQRARRARETERKLAQVPSEG